MNAYCPKCKKKVEGLEGYYYWKCPKHYIPLKLNFFQKIYYSFIYK